MEPHVPAPQSLPPVQSGQKLELQEREHSFSSLSAPTCVGPRGMWCRGGGLSMIIRSSWLRLLWPPAAGGG